MKILRTAMLMVVLLALTENLFNARKMQKTHGNVITPQGQYPASQWIFCAKEDKICGSYPNPNDVNQIDIRYGSRGKYNYKYDFKETSVWCNNNNFGDPIKEDKTCEYFIHPWEPKAEWVVCANENGQCEFHGQKIVRYGNDGIYDYGIFTDEANCNDATFYDVGRLLKEQNKNSQVKCHYYNK